MKRELLDVFDEYMNLIGNEDRKIVHKNGLWHQTFHCWIAKKVGNEWFLFFQLRQDDKDTFPNYFDVTSAGHLNKGEKPEEGIRELEEELGINLRLTDLEFIGTFKEIKSGESFIDREFHHTYIYFSDKGIEQFSLQKEELKGIVEIPLNDLILLFNHKIGSVDANGYEIDKIGNEFNFQKKIGIGQFVPHKKDYYNAVFQYILQKR